MNIIKRYGLILLLILNLCVTCIFTGYLYMKTTENRIAMIDIVNALGQSRILEKQSDGQIRINKVITVADVEKMNEVQRPNGGAPVE